MTRKSYPTAKRLVHRQPSKKERQKRIVTVKRLPEVEEFYWRLYSILLECLSQINVLTSEEVEVFSVCLRKRSYEDLRDLKVSWLTQSNQPGEAGAASVACKLLLGRLLVKLPGPSTHALKDECLKSVLTLDKSLYAPALAEPEDPVVEATRRWVGRILGQVPDIGELNKTARHGPGSTARTSYTFRDAYFKYADWPYAVTSNCRGLFKQLILDDERWFGALEQSYRQRFGIAAWSILDWDAFWATVLVTVNCNVVTAVPKNRFKNRPIAKEPLGNVYCQLAIGAIMKDRLRSFGVDLSDQTRNQQLARLGSLDPSPLSPCTFDLSNASDTISAAVCEALLPPWWFCLLDTVRSPYGEFPTQCWRYAKMSSMGNGTTFELESTIFYALLRAVQEIHGDVGDSLMTSVFGDDLIFPRYLAPIVERYLRAFGFTVNVSKSFTQGSFMESCGCDWYHGIDVRPVHCEDRDLSLPNLLSIRNRLHRWFRRKLGCNLPTAVDVLFSSYIDGWNSLLGPEDDNSFDSWVHVPCYKGYTRGHRCVKRVLVKEKPSDFWFGKLKHSLRTCESESDASHFEIARPGIGWRVQAEAPNPSRTIGYYAGDGTLQDHVGPTFEELVCSPGHP